MRPRFKEILAHLDHWKRALMGPVVGIPLLVYQQATGRSPSLGWFGCLVASGLAWDFYTHWQEAKKRAIPDVPKLFTYIPTPDGLMQSDKSGLFLQTQDVHQAANVRITSAECVGPDHSRLMMDWKRPAGYIGNQPVAVEVTCMCMKNGKKEQRGAPRDQIRLFLSHKKDDSKEMIVTVEYTDIAGHKCPDKKFRVFLENNRIARLYGTEKIDCQPVQN